MDKHRDKKLDKYLGKQVRIVFFDGTIKDGKLEYEDELPFNDRKPNFYYIGNLGFRKSHVKSIVPSCSYLNMKK